MSWISPRQPALVLAPMEGVTDAPMRALLTELGGLDFCVSEFLRVTRVRFPPFVFFRHMPELRKGSVTPSGVPVQLQLLGGEPEVMAANAAMAVQLGATAIDINFGCPSKTVNRSDGGATLLKCPERIEWVVRAVRDAVPAAIPVSAKVRLGWESIEDIHENAERAEKGGASWLTIHARTRAQGYGRPVYWHKIGEVKKNLGIPVVANGDIWSMEDFLRCREVTGCEHFMVGRGAIANPYLARQISRELGTRWEAPVDEKEWGELVSRLIWWGTELNFEMQFMPGRIKQWLRMAALVRPNGWFERVKTARTLDEITGVFAS